MKEINIRPLLENDWPSVKEIYESGMSTGIATFETEAPNWEEWNKKYLPFCRLVAHSESEIVGWASLSPYSIRPVYKGVAEISLYVSEKKRGKGIGKKLLNALIPESEANGIWTLQAHIFPQNEVSIALHKKLGFKEVGLREKIGKRDGIWYDNILLERRK